MKVLLKARVFCDKCKFELNFPFSIYPITNIHDLEAINQMFEKDVDFPRRVRCQHCDTEYLWVSILRTIQDTCHNSCWDRSFIFASLSDEADAQLASAKTARERDDEA